MRVGVGGCVGGGMWVCGCVGVWVCGCVWVWVCMYVYSIRINVHTHTHTHTHIGLRALVEAGALLPEERELLLASATISGKSSTY